MASFKDAEDRLWTVELDYVTADEIKAEKGMDLIDPSAATDNIVRIMGGGTRFLVELLWFFVYPKADKLKVTPEDFGRAMKPAAVGSAYSALREALADFFHPFRPDVAEAIRRVWEASDKAVRTLTESQMEQLDLAIEKKLQELPFANSGGNSLASPGSIPTVAG